MSESDYDEFRRAHADVVAAAAEFRARITDCIAVDASDAEAGFRACVDDGYSAFDEGAETALALAEEQLASASRRCRTALNSYVIVLERYAAQLRALHQAASPSRFERVPPQSRRYIKFAADALQACAPA